MEDLEESQAEQSARVAQPDLSLRQPRKPAQRKPLPPHLSRETVVHEPTIICACHGCDRAKLVRLGEDVTEVVEKIPARLKVIRHVRPRYACRSCEAVFQAPAPELPIERGRPGPGLIANVAVSKFCHGLPLYRQSVILGREGIEIDRATLAGWLGHAAWWLSPLAVLIGQYVMRSPVIHTDAYAGYGALYRANGNQPPRVTHVACLAHARRKFFEVFAGRNRRSPRKRCAASPGSMRLKSRSPASPPRYASPSGRPPASRCSTSSRPRPTGSADASPARPRSARRSDIRLDAGRC